MSGLLAGKVWQSGLAPHLKPLAAALADIANDDGTAIRPSVAYAAWLLGRSERAVQDGLAELRNSGVLTAVRHVKGGRASDGRGMPVEYSMDESRLPSRPTWRETKDATVAPLAEGKGADPDIEGCSSEQQRVKQAAPDPSVDPSVDPSQKEPRERVQSNRNDPTDEAFIFEAIAQFGDALGGERVVRDEIAAALNHTASRKAIDKRKYVLTWLRRAVEFRRGDDSTGAARVRPGGPRGGPSRPAHATPTPGGRSLQDIALERQARKAAAVGS